MYKRKKRKTEIWMSVICWGMCMYFRNKNKSHWFSLSLITTSRFSCFSLAIYFVSSSLLSLSAHGKRWLMVFFLFYGLWSARARFFSFFIGYLLILAFLLQRSMSKGNTTIIGRQKKMPGGVEFLLMRTWNEWYASPCLFKSIYGKI